MRRREFLVASAALAAAPSVLAQDNAAGLVVHEWGVVTVAQSHPVGMARSEGASFVDGVEKAEQLPAFVTTFEAAFGRSIQDWENRPVRKPVLYFHAPRAMNVQVRVRIPKGRPHAWWPAADYAPKPLLPAKGIQAAPEDWKIPTPADAPLENGSLSWAIALDPDAATFGDAQGWWPIARKPKATPVVSGKQADKFLFYDALTAFDPGLDIAWSAEGRATVVAAGPMPSLFAIRVKDGVCASASASLARGERAELAPKKGKPDLAGALVKAGLNKDEADAVDEIWKEEFYEAPGARILAVLPRATYDALLPIEITPAPAALERVLVAHIECLDPDRRPQIEKWIGQLGSDSLDERDTAAAELRKAGPLAEKAIRDAIAGTKDADVKSRLMDVLKK